MPDHDGALIREVLPWLNGWAVRPKNGSRLSSWHVRKLDAIARAKEILQNGGGGQWLLLDPNGNVVESGNV